MAEPAKKAPPSKPAGKSAASGKSTGKSGKEETRPALQFQFDARSKPITENMLELEGKRQKRLLSKKTKFPISDIAVMLDKQANENELTKPLTNCVMFYKKNEKDGNLFLEALGRLILEAAAKEQNDANYQKYLIYQALDTFSISVQHSDKRINSTSEGMMVSIFKILSPINSAPYYVEKEILKTMSGMISKKDLNDLESRDKIIKLCMKGKRYYEALYQLVEYEKIMQLRSRTMHMMKAGEIQFRKATVFQHMIDFYNGVAGGQAQKQQVQDMGKLRSFITRFNADNSRAKLTPLAGKGPLAINKTLGSLISVANLYYGEAASNSRFAHRHKAYYCMAHNNVTTDKIKMAVNNLLSGMEVLAKSSLKAIEKGNEKIQFLETIIKVYNDQGAPRKAEEFAKQLNALRTNVRQMESKKRADDAKRKELMGG